MIEIEGLSKIYAGAGRPALKEVSLNVPKGAIYGILGRSGAGKSTLIRCLNLLERPTAGRIIVNGNDITQLDKTGLREHRLRTGMIFQHFNLLHARTVADNVAVPLEIAGVAKDQRQARVEELLWLVGLSEKAHAFPSQLSGGQKQRVGIARALAAHPDVLLCDEATSALDPETTASVLELLADINQKLQLTIVLITHELEVVKTLCDHAALLENGEVIESGKSLICWLLRGRDCARRCCTIRRQSRHFLLVMVLPGGRYVGSHELGGSLAAAVKRLAGNHLYGRPVGTLYRADWSAAGCTAVYFPQ